VENEPSRVEALLCIVAPATDEAGAARGEAPSPASCGHLIRH
jgi:hypothetical protein